MRKSGGVARVEVTKGAVTERAWELRKREAWFGSLRSPPKLRHERKVGFEPAPPPTEHPLAAIYRGWLEKQPRSSAAPPAPSEPQLEARQPTGASPRDPAGGHSW